MSASVMPFLVSETTTSLAVPVLVPAGSPFTKSSVVGAAAGFRSNGASVGSGGGAAAVAGGGVAWVCARAPNPHTTSRQVMTNNQQSLFCLQSFILVSLATTITE